MDMKSLPLGVTKGAWTEEEDTRLRKCIEKYGEGKWHQVPLKAGLNRCRKSCRLRWLNYLQPNIKRGEFAFDEVDLILKLHKLLGNRWSLIAGRLPGRTANDVKNYWNRRGKKTLSPRGDQSKNFASEIIGSKIVKPKPLKLSKRTSWLNKKTAAEVHDKPSTSSAPPGLSDDVMQWWETLFVKANEIGQGKRWSSFSAFEEEHVKELW